MTKTTADKLLDLMARECERAYRRGFQQGKVIGPHLSELEVFNWRYGKPLTKAPSPETRRPIDDISPRDRLKMECATVGDEVDQILRRGKP